MNYIVDKLLGMPKYEAYSFLENAAENGLNEEILLKIWNGYKHLFTPREIHNLNEMTINHYYETGDESGINLFGEPNAKVDEEED
jgi:hypothetical protein